MPAVYGIQIGAGRLASGGVMNQSPVFQDVDLFASDRVLREAMARENADWAHDEAAAFGRLAGSANTLELGRLANENPPKARLID